MPCVLANRHSKKEKKEAYCIYSSFGLNYLAFTITDSIGAFYKNRKIIEQLLFLVYIALEYWAVQFRWRCITDSEKRRTFRLFCGKNHEKPLVFACLGMKSLYQKSNCLFVSQFFIDPSTTASFPAPSTKLLTNS